MPLAKRQLIAPKCIAAIDRMLGLGHRVGADVDAIDAESAGVQPGVEQGHGQRIRLFSGRTRQAEQPQWTRARQLRQALVGKTGQGGEGVGVTEEPGFRNDDRLDQRLLLGRRLLQTQPVIVQVSGVHRNAALAQGTLDHGRAHRLHVQADAFLQKAEELPLVDVASHVATAP
ncbi:hypothetical protein D3C80_1663470 [compost metagenome]